MILLAPLLLATLTGCLHEDNCDRAGYTPLLVQLVSASPAPAAYGGGCTIYTDITDDDESWRSEQLRHIGLGVYECLTGTATGTESGEPFYSETLWFRIDGYCANSGHYGCMNLDCRTIDANLSNIGAGCPAGMSSWGEACWTQFYKVIASEIMHGWLGKYH